MIRHKLRKRSAIAQDGFFLTGPIPKGMVKHFSRVEERLKEAFGKNLRHLCYQREQADTENNYDHYHLAACFKVNVDFKRLVRVIGVGSPHNRKMPEGQPWDFTRHYVMKGHCGIPNCNHRFSKDKEKPCRDYNQNHPKGWLHVIGEYGVMPGKKGQRCDLDTARELLKEHKTWPNVMADTRLTHITSRYHKWARDIFDNKPIPRMDEEVWNQLKMDWHTGVLELLEQPANYRDIIWIWSNEGNRGKSLLTAYLVQNKEAIVVGGKTADMLYQYSKTLNDIIVLDMPRSGVDFINYGAIESLKNGVFAVNKYDSKMVVRGTPAHLIVLANEPPADGKLSEDRLKVFNVDESLEAMMQGTKAWGWDA